MDGVQRGLLRQRCKVVRQDLLYVMKEAGLGSAVGVLRTEGLDSVLATFWEAVVAQGAELGLLRQSHQEDEQFALAVLTL